jgi:hypothetical protein
MPHAFSQNDILLVNANILIKLNQIEPNVRITLKTI